MRTRKLTRIKFFAIKRELVSTNRRQADIAADYDVSPSTVGNINQAGTWENYTAGKKAAKQLRSGRARLSDPVVRREKAQKAGLNPVTREERAEKQLAIDLAALETRPTREEFQTELGTVHGRQDALLKRIQTTEADNALQGKWIVGLGFLVVVAIVLAVVL